MEKIHHGELYRQCGQVIGALAHLRTPDVGHRRYPRDPEDIFAPDDYERDEGALDGCKTLRGMSWKTQVTTLHGNWYIRNRMSHTLEVKGIAIRIARMLGLNVKLVRAGAIGHDIGHVPFGHQGEEYLATRLGRPFCHEVMGLVMAQHIERKCKGLNLTWEVLMCMLCHSGDMAKKYKHLMSPEAMVVQIADKIAYLFADYNDFVNQYRVRYPLPEEVREAAAWFGETQRERVQAVTAALCIESARKGRVEFVEGEIAERFAQFRTMMYRYYPRVTQQELRFLDHIYDFIDSTKCGVHPALAIALMTDRDVLFLRDKVLNFDDIMRTGVGERLEHIAGRNIDMCNLDIDWGIPAGLAA